MARTKVIVVAAVLATAAGVTWFVKSGSHAESSAAIVQSQVQASAHAAQAPMPAIAAAPSVTRAGAARAQAVPVAADRVVARVNGAAITGRDLVAFGNATPGSQSMSSEMYDALLERAIDRELVVQQARKQGITLDDVRKHQLDQVRAAQAARTPDDQGQIEWEARDAEGRLLLDTLLAHEGTSAIPTQKDVDGYYDAHRADFGDMPRTNADLDIRQTLAGDMTASYQQSERAFRQRLRAAASVERAD
jgi:hypothetical protein